MVLASAAIVATAVVAVVLVLALGGASKAVPDDLARVAPPAALLWVDAAAGRPASSRAWTLATRFPALRAAPQAIARRLGLSGFEPARDLRPWLGDEIGVALVAQGAGTAPLVLAKVEDAGAARRTLARLGARPAGRADDAALFAPAAGTTPAGGAGSPAAGMLVALTGDRLVAGPAAAVRAAIARADGHGAALDDAPAYRRAVEERGDGVVAAYAPAAGVRGLLAAADPLARAAAALIDGPGLQAVAAEGSPEGGGMRVHAHLLRAGGAAAPATVAPTLLGRVPANAAAMLLLPGGEAVARLTERLGGGALVAGVRAALATESGLDLDRDVLAPLREAAISLQARGDVPVVTVAARTAAPATTREALARAQSPLATRLTGGADQAFEPFGSGGFTLPVTPRLQPTYAVDGDVLVAGTAQPALEQRRVAARGIAAAPALSRLLAGREGSVQSLGFVDLRQLLGLGERTGLATTSGFQAVRADLGPVRTAGAVLEQDTDHPTDTTAELFLEIP